MHTLAHVQSAPAALREVARVLEPGGKFIFLVRRKPGRIAACHGTHVR